VVTERPAEGLRALVVDDDRAIRDLLRAVLELDGWLVEEAEDGDQALDRARSAPPHAMVLDIMMPAKDGFAVLSELRRDPRGRDIAIVVLTAKTQPADILRGTRLGADAYITKPFDPDDVARQLVLFARRRSPGRMRSGAEERLR